MAALFYQLVRHSYFDCITECSMYRYPVFKAALTNSKWIFSRARQQSCSIQSELLKITYFSTSITTMSCQGFSCQSLDKKLTPQQYRVTQEKGTERAFTGEYYDHHEKGTYTCICCAAPLFSSETKYDSGSGWPSFFKTLEQAKNVESVERISDSTHGMIRVEVVCRSCKAHLGHVFDDGPMPTGERFCINSASLNFVGAEK